LYGTSYFYAVPAAALFGWLAIYFASNAWCGSMGRLREMAAVDGAGSWQTAWRVVLPSAWPQLLGGLVVVFLLAMTETAAATLLVPGTIVNTMMTNMHTLAYAPMASAALLSMLVCGGLAIVIALLLTPRRIKRAARVAPLLLVGFVILGCDDTPQPDAVWSETGRGEGQVTYPRGIVYSPVEDVFWIVDRTARVQKLNAADGEFVLGFAMPEKKYGNPVGISVDAAGNVWVPDTHYHRVIVYTPDGTEWFRFGGYGNELGQFIWPTDVLHAGDLVFVGEYGQGVDAQGDRITVFRRDDTTSPPTLAPERTIGGFGNGPGQFRRPQSMVMLDGLLWVADSSNHRLLAFDPSTGDLM
ncbi:MAG: ABC transporter permease subunit, partial [Planctomycetota bacterium]